MAQDPIRANLARAIDAMRSGRVEEAIRALEAGGGAALKTAVGRNIRGDVFLKQGQYQDALRSFDAAVKLAPSAPEGYCNRGVALEALGRLDEALAALDRALRYRADYATAHFNRGNVLKALQRNGDAIAAYGKALTSRPDYAEALVNRGTALLAAGKAQEALGDFGRALAGKPNLAAAQIGRAKAYSDLGEYDTALATLATVLKAEPQNLEALRLRHGVLTAAGRYEEALAAIDALPGGSAEDAVAYRERATVLSKLRRPERALAAAENALRLAPGDSETHVTYGKVLNEAGRLEEGLAAFDRAAALGASGEAFLAARAVARAAIGDPREALADFAAALAINPANAETHVNRAFLLIGSGKWEEGWPEHEWRLTLPRNAPPAAIRQIAPWQGESLAGKHLLVHYEQGHGDTFQFVRYLRKIDLTGATVTLLVPGAMRRLLADSFPDIDVTDTLSMREGLDYRVSLMSLPAIFGTTLNSVPAEVPYLVADPARVAAWGERIGRRGFRVGIVWQGNPDYPRDRDRLVPLAAFAPLASVPGVRLISVQAMVGLEQLDALPAGMEVERLGAALENNPDGFREMAAIIENLDLLIMSDTGPTHLAAALGRRVWLATSRYPDWRWMREREDTPWYPTMRLFRQTAAGDWDGVFARMAGELAAVAAERSEKA